MPRQSLDVPEDLPKQALCPVALGQLGDEVSRMPDETPAGLEPPLLEARQRPTLNGEGQKKSALKMLFHREDRRLLGIHYIGTGATELVHVGPSAIRSPPSTPRTNSALLPLIEPDRTCDATVSPLASALVRARRARSGRRGVIMSEDHPRKS